MEKAERISKVKETEEILLKIVNLIQKGNTMLDNYLGSSEWRKPRKEGE